MNIFAERLRKVLDSRGINQVTLAENTNITAATISRYLTIDRVPRGDNIAVIAGALNVSADYLLGLSDDPLPLSQEIPLDPETRLLVTCYRRSSHSDQRVIWTLLDKYMKPEERDYVTRLLKKTSESAG